MFNRANISCFTHWEGDFLTSSTFFFGGVVSQGLHHFNKEGFKKERGRKEREILHQGYFNNAAWLIITYSWNSIQQDVSLHASCWSKITTLKRCSWHFPPPLIPFINDVDNEPPVCLRSLFTFTMGLKSSLCLDRTKHSRCFTCLCKTCFFL